MVSRQVKSRKSVVRYNVSANGGIDRRKLACFRSLRLGKTVYRRRGRAWPERKAVDHQLMQRLHGGDRGAATAIYVRYAERLLNVAQRNTPVDLRGRFDPEDVVQSVFRTFFRRAASGAYAVPEGEELWKLFLVIALNKIRRLGAFHRSAKRDIGKTAVLEAPVAESTEPTSEDSLRILEMTINEVIARLPEHAQQMVRLRIEGCDVAAIAAQSARSKRSVERVLQSFRAEMAKELAADDIGTGEDAA